MQLTNTQARFRAFLIACTGMLFKYEFTHNLRSVKFRRRVPAWVRTAAGFFLDVRRMHDGTTYFRLKKRARTL